MNPVPVPKSFRHLLSRSQVCTVPNLLTLLRLLLIPFLFYACRIRADILLSVFLLLLTGLLDVLDGLIARKLTRWLTN